VKSAKANPKAFKPADRSEIGSFIGHAKMNGKTFAEASSKMGFPTPFTRASVFVTDCMRRANQGDDSMSWFGGDQIWEWRNYNDPYSRLRKVLSDKGFNPSFFYDLDYRDM
jgi:hypothetical protein